MSSALMRVRVLSCTCDSIIERARSIDRTRVKRLSHPYVRDLNVRHACAFSLAQHWSLAAISAVSLLLLLLSYIRSKNDFNRRALGIAIDFTSLVVSSIWNQVLFRYKLKQNLSLSAHHSFVAQLPLWSVVCWPPLSRLFAVGSVFGSLLVLFKELLLQTTKQPGY